MIVFSLYPRNWGLNITLALSFSQNSKFYRLRKYTVEPIIGIIKEVMGFHQFSLRGLNLVQGEWSLVCLAFNLKRLHRLSNTTLVSPTDC